MSTRDSIQRRLASSKSLVYGTLNERGHEVPDPTPVAMPLGLSRPEPIHVMIQRLVRTELSQQAQQQDMETWEEADDFDIEDDELDPLTPYEAFFEGGLEVEPSENPLPDSSLPGPDDKSPPEQNTAPLDA